MVYLLDINALIALCDNHHIHHEIAHRWFMRQNKPKWATCPLTENGFLRILGNPNYPHYPGSPSVVLSMLQTARSIVNHHFWPDSKSILEIVKPGILMHSSHITDIYLLGLAVANGGKLATFDRKIPVQTVIGGEKAVEWME